MTQTSTFEPEPRSLKMPAVMAAETRSTASDRFGRNGEQGIKSKKKNSKKNSLPCQPSIPPQKLPWQREIQIPW